LTASSRRRVRQLSFTIVGAVAELLHRSYVIFVSGWNWKRMENAFGATLTCRVRETALASAASSMIISDQVSTSVVTTSSYSNVTVAGC